MFLPPCGATSTPTGSPSPSKPAAPFINEIDVFAGFSPMRAVSGLSSIERDTR